MLEKILSELSPSNVKLVAVSKTKPESAILKMYNEGQRIFGENRDIYFPKLSEDLHLISFSDIAKKYIEQLGYVPRECENEEEARKLASSSTDKGEWPCLFVSSDTTGEKDFEEFFTSDETLDLDRFQNLGIIKNKPVFDNDKLERFSMKISAWKEQKYWTKEEIVDLFFEMIPDFGHIETGRYLDSKM